MANRAGVSPRRFRRAFTLVELIVVMTVIVLVLALAIPGLTAMNSQARLSSAWQTVNGVLTRAYFIATADMTMTAVRALPGLWDTDEAAKKSTGRQHLAIYTYTGTSAHPTDLNKVEYGEYFQRVKGVNSAELPEDVWVGPLEALSQDAVKLGNTNYANFGQDFVLNGTAGAFAYNANRNVPPPTDGGAFLSADDFLIVFDPRAGMRGGIPTPYRLRAYAPSPIGCGYETDFKPNTSVYFQRYNFTGVVVYRREGFAALGTGATGSQRQVWLRSNGKAYMAHRFSGGLLSGAQGR